MALFEPRQARKGVNTKLAAGHWHELFGDCRVQDALRLAREWARLPAQAQRPARWPEKFARAVADSQADVAARRARAPRAEYPSELPVSERRDEIAAALRAHQVVIVCGETGSGKTTQLPKICLELGLGARGLIGHTQPRRIAARNTAARIAEELGVELGGAVGYKVRFTDHTRPDACVKLMTDGILLAETQTDRLLAAYDTLIIDEAHERSLNIDFLLGYLRRLLADGVRPDLKLVITSATIDADRFAEHFAHAGRPAPIIEVSGRLYPIELRWRPADKGERDPHEHLADAVEEAMRCGPGDVLVFLPGEREIREAAETLRKRHASGPGLRPEILPLFARQSAVEQQRVFQPSGGRRGVLATNVAETSLTVPGIRYVVDTGLARVKRYSARNKVEQLQVENIAQSAARQRAGRCGRVAAGVCLRLYAEDDFERRAAHTDPEILRSSLAGVILRMKSLGLGRVEDFPFLDQPAPRFVQDGYQLLAELDAIDEAKELTPLGVELARLPLDPKIGRMILAARDGGALREVLVIAAALSAQDPRERPEERAASADQAHGQFHSAGEGERASEFLWYWKLWQAFDQVWQHESSAKQRQWCRGHFLNFLRMREWRDVHAQLHTIAAEHGWRENTQPAGYEQIHRALLSGLLGNLGCRIEDARPGEPPYLGARGIKFYPHPGSRLHKKAGRWIVAAELVETTRLYARTLARVEPEWVEAVAAHLVRRSVYEPHWSKARGEAMAWERGVLYGLPLYTRRAVRYAPIDAAAARELMLMDGLVRGEWPEHAARQAGFLRHNEKLVADIEHLEQKQRRPDVLVDEDLIHAFYDAKIPAEICDVAAFERWRKEAERKAPRLLYLEREQLMRHEAAGITTERFPPLLDVLGQKLPLTYKHEPGAADDGVTLTLPLALLNQVSDAQLSWLVPGLLAEKVGALAKTVPQKIRHRLQPVGEFVTDFCAREADFSQPLAKVLARAIEDAVQLKLPVESMRQENLPAHLSMHLRVVDEYGRVLDSSRNLAELRTRLKTAVERQFAGAEVAPAEPAQADAATAPSTAPSSGLTTWSFGTLPELMEVRIGGREVVGFPALEDEGASVAVRVFDTPEKARAVHRGGLRRLFALALKDGVRGLTRAPGLRDAALAYLPFGGDADFFAQLLAATLERSCMAEPWPADADAFALRCKEGGARMQLVGQELLRLAVGVLNERAALQKKFGALKAFPEAAADMSAQLDALVGRDFLQLPYERLQHLPRYLKAVAIRLDKLRNDPARDARSQQEWKALAAPFERERTARARAGVIDAQLDEFRWLLEELRVQLFAQELRTPVPVSAKRLQKIWETRQRD
ncbi:MAG: ATP-dependent RNA helicase HrpA [Rhodocyclaceae bacterium]|nr:ATP-dependent RNA helicase HrpA [Rhodocyclaceae bacterium]